MGCGINLNLITIDPSLSGAMIMTVIYIKVPTACYSLRL